MNIFSHEKIFDLTPPYLTVLKIIIQNDCKIQFFTVYVKIMRNWIVFQMTKIVKKLNLPLRKY